MSSYVPHGLDIPFEEVSERLAILKHLGIHLVSAHRPDVVCTEMPITEKTLNLLHTPHGGVLATLIDCTGAMTCAALTGFRGSTADLHVRFLAAPKGGTIHAEGRVSGPVGGSASSTSR